MNAQAATSPGTPQRALQLGDARHGKLAANLSAFGRALRRAGVPVDSARIALAQQALLEVGLARKQDVNAALEAIFVSREEDREVYRELFELFFRDPEMAKKLMAQLLPSAGSNANPPPERPRVREAMTPPKAEGSTPEADPEDKIELDAAMTASTVVRVKKADFNQLAASEYHLVEKLVRDVPLPLPTLPTRRTRASERGAHVHWSRTLRSAARTGGDITALQRRHRRRAPLPLLVLVDVSGSMERYARLLLAFIHAATGHAQRVDGQNMPLRRDVFAFGTRLTDLGGAFRQADTDRMLLEAGATIKDFAGGTRLGECLAQLRSQYARRLVARRTLVLLISDGLDTGDPAVLEDELAWLKRRSRRLLWLNPLLRFDGYTPSARGAAILHDAADGMLAVHNVTRLEQLAGAIAALVKQP